MPSTDSTEGVGVPTPLQNFYVTFGMMYRYEKHPYWEWAHPDGWLLVKAPDEEAARLLLRQCIGNRYAFIYTEGRLKQEYHPMGRIATISTDGTSSVERGVFNGHAYPPGPLFTTSRPEYYGREADEVVCARIEGKLAENSDADAIANLGYEVEHVHQRCFTAGIAMFDYVTDVDYRVLADELDWAQPYECPVCNTSIT